MGNNPKGHPPTLVASHPGHQNRLVHGYYSKRRELSPEAAALADDLMALPHVVEGDRIAAEEVARLVTLIARVDDALADGVVENRRRGSARELLLVRDKLSGRLASWLDRFGLTPSARAGWVRQLSGNGLGAEIRRRMEEAQE